MDTTRAKRILEEVLEANQKEQQVIITQPDDAVPTPHNGVTSETARFIDSLSDDRTMAKLVDETSDNAIRLIEGIDKNV